MLSLILASVFVVIALMHFYWAAGGTFGISAVIPQIPQPGADVLLAFTPGKVGTALVGCAFLAVAGILLMYGNWLPHFIPSNWLRRLVVLLGVILLLRALGDFKYVGFTKRVKGTPFAEMDTRFYSPLCALLGAGVFGLFLVSKDKRKRLWLRHKR